MSNDTPNGDGESEGSKYLREKSLEEEAKEVLKTAAEEMGEPLSQQDYLNWRDEQAADKPTTPTLKRRIGDDGTDWSTICDICGIVGHNANDYYSDADIETALQQAAEDMGQPLSVSNYRSWRSKQDTDQPSFKAITRRGRKTWREACERVGICVSPTSHRGVEYTDEQIKSALQRAANEIGEPLSYEEYDEWVDSIEDDVPAVSTTKRLGDGSWVAALQSVGIQPAKRDRNEYTKQDIKSSLKQAAENVGEKISIREYDKWGRKQPEDHPIGETVAKRVGGGSWNKAKQNVLQKTD